MGTVSPLEGERGGCREMCLLLHPGMLGPTHCTLGSTRGTGAGGWGVTVPWESGFQWG